MIALPEFQHGDATLAKLRNLRRFFRDRMGFVLIAIEPPTNIFQSSMSIHSTYVYEMAQSQWMLES